LAAPKIHLHPGWRQQAEGYINLGYTQDTLWIRLHINNLQLTDYKPLLQIAYSRLDIIELYKTDDGKTFNRLYSAGDLLPFSSRPIDHSTFLFPLHIARQSSSYIYLRIRSDSAIQIPLHLWSERYFLSKDRVTTLGQGLFYGATFVMFFYNVFLSIASKRASYFTYALNIAAGTLLTASLSGYGYEFLWPNSPEFQDKAPALFMALTSITVQMFSVSFYGYSKLTNSLQSVQKALFSLNVIGIISALTLHHTTTVTPLIFLIMLAAISAYYLGIKLLLQKNIAARYYMTGWTVLIIGTFDIALSKLGVTSFSETAILRTQLAMCVEIILFSFALAEQINQHKKSQIEAEFIARTQEKKANEHHRKLLQVEKKATQTTEKAHAEIAANTDFIASMSHELRTPMNGVIGMADLLKTTRLTDKQKRYVDTIYDSGEALITIINDILDISKIDAGKMALECSEFSIDELMDQCMSVFALKANSDNIEYFGIVDPRTPKTLIGDTTRLRQVLLNLLGNAFKFTEKGSVILRIEPDLSGNTGLPANQTQVRISITDTGIGIAPNKIPSIFDPYHQEETSLMQRKGGGGLGLSICKKIVEELMDGTIGVNSTPNHGSTFWFTLPIPYISSSTIAPIKPPEDTNFRLLIADFDTPFTQILKDQAKELNLSISAFNSSEDFIASVKKTSLDEGLILCIGEGFKPSSQESLQELVSYPPYDMIPGIIIAPPQKINQSTAMTYVERPITSPQVFRWLNTHINGERKILRAATKINKQLFGTQILVAEDNNVNQLVIRSMLESLGANIYIVENGQEAVNHYREHHALYDLILMDCEMPIMDGYQASEQIHKTAQQLNIAAPIIIALSAHVLAEHRQKATKAGMKDFISKPVMRGKLATCLARNLPEKDWDGFVHPSLKEQDNS